MKASIMRNILLALIGAILVGGGLLYLMNAEGDKPELKIDPDIVFTNGRSPLTLLCRDAGMGLESVKVGLIQGDTRVKILSSTFPQAQDESEKKFSLPLEEMEQGNFTLVASCTDSSWTSWGGGNTRTLKKEMVLDTKPPMVSILTSRTNLNQGGSGLVLFEVSEAVPKCGVQVGNQFFPAYARNKGPYYCLFSFPYSADPDKDVPKVVARDRAGNEYQSGFYYHVNSRDYTRDKIRVPDSFLRAKMPQFQGKYPEKEDLLQLFLKVNNELRKENRSELQRIGRDTAKDLLIDGDFIRHPGSRESGFGDKRTYFYKGRKIDKQRHLGVDLASVAKAKVSAANSGKVVYAGFMGIYGNVVIIDHGLGLQSLYAHLSKVGVQKGEKVEKGQSIGRSGATGLAGGDHLHFAILISGTPVNPVEWWDKTWIKHNIWSKMDRDK